MDRFPRTRAKLPAWRPGRPESPLVCNDPSRNMARFYGLGIAPDLFGSVVLIRTLGRARRRGQKESETFGQHPNCRRLP
ncbi:WGR domain-containing protein [Paracoccus sp. 22332]|uniref:WGR domain-containing protein n=1 Tax=Paracoccus sp. 22332 TaxID=3453913 RepID=UPI003F876265